MPARPPSNEFDRVWNGLTYVYLLRVPLLAWALLVALPILALPSQAPLGSLCRGLFDIVDPQTGGRFLSFAFVTLAGLMTAATIAVTARLVIRDGGARFDIVEAPNSDGINLAIRVVPVLAPLSIIAGAWWLSVPVAGWTSAIVGTFLGTAVFLVLMTTFHAWFWDQVFPPPTGRRALGPIELGNLPEGARKALAATATFLLRIFAFVIERTPQGFVGPDGRLWARHVFALFQLLFSLALYALLALVKSGTSGTAPRVPTLCIVLILVMLLCWGLAGLSFLFDRYRVPILSLLLVYGWLMSVFPQSDHFFQSYPRPTGPVASVSAAQMLEKRMGSPAIVVAASGGGIQAAAWTARVLAGLKHDADGCGSDQFDRAMLAISAVSGGAVGAMFVVDSYEGGRMPAVPALDDSVTVKAAEASSLDEVAWGVAYPDLVFNLVPFVKGVSLAHWSLVNGPNLVVDRGWALENTWKREGTRLERATLDQWRGEALSGVRPAVIFNGTIAETGERMLLATTGFDRNEHGRRDFVREYPESDVPVTTAARLSATFPWVSPPARILRHGIFSDEYHLVDGGYYDNYGTATLVEWLNDGLRASTAARPTKMLLLQIRSSPTGAPAEPAGGRGWTYEVTQPLETLLAVRDTGQLSHSDIDVDILQREVYPGPRVPIETRVIEFPSAIAADGDDETPPLSWHLTPRDRAQLRKAWSLKIADRRFVQSFLGGVNADSCIVP
ncbi:MAG: hypothetical protein AUJ01_04115 [Acidobacteria bacterium 13_1_40CM_3_65_5]|nr:MAG: hypothetical protein AUJ01_04115 [Acidobacteria bacterium 13_1_40CM_3_65_5]